jgi:hypothetical protein
MKEMSARSAGRAVALVWDSVVIAAPAVRSPTGSKFTMETGFRGDAGYREAQQLAACLRSGSAPVPLTEAPPEVELPKSVTYFLRRAYPRCRLLTYDDYGPGMWSGLFAELRRRLASYREHDHPFAVSGDFDANGKNDWAFLLKCGQKVRLVALHHAGTTWKPHLVSEAFYQNGFQVGVGGFSVYLEPAHKGKSRGNWELGRLVVLPRDGFEEVFAEKAAWLWLWDGKKYTRFVSRD